MNKLNDMEGLFHSLWKKKTFQQAYKEEDQDHILPFVMKEVLTESICVAPEISKKKGRPKKKRQESQQASVALSQKKQKKCRVCGVVGHNKRTCSSRL
jgi:hypothetical protein